jgi:uncharacterized lipoprotein
LVTLLYYGAAPDVLCSAATKQRNSDQGRHILVVNDDGAILDLVCELLSEEGYEITLDNFRHPTAELPGVVREL